MIYDTRRSRSGTKEKQIRIHLFLDVAADSKLYKNINKKSLAMSFAKFK